MTTRPDEVPADLVKPLAEMLLADYDSEFDASHLSWQDFAGQARKILTAVLPLTYRYWCEQAFGTEAEIRARGADAANRKPDDIAKLCELVRPGWHEQQVRERVAEEIEARRCDSTEICGSCRCRAEDAATARGSEPEDVAIGCQRATTAIENEADPS